MKVLPNGNIAVRVSAPDGSEESLELSGEEAGIGATAATLRAAAVDSLDGDADDWLTGERKLAQAEGEAWAPTQSPAYLPMPKIVSELKAEQVARLNSVVAWHLGRSLPVFTERVKPEGYVGDPTLEEGAGSGADRGLSGGGPGRPRAATTSRRRGPRPGASASPTRRPGSTTRARRARPTAASAPRRRTRARSSACPRGSPRPGACVSRPPAPRGPRSTPRRATPGTSGPGSTRTPPRGSRASAHVVGYMSNDEWQAARASSRLGAGGGFFLVKWSQGTCYGDAGYKYVSVDYLLKHAVQWVVVTPPRP